MSNKKIMKEVFDKNLNMNIIHDEMVAKIEKQERKKQINRKYILVPVTAIIIAILLMPIISSNNKNGEYRNISNNQNDVININIIKNENEKSILYDIDGRIVDKNQEELALDFPFINTMEIPLDNGNIVRTVEMYGSSNLNNKNYNTLIGYNLIYNNIVDTAYNENDSYIDIFFSKTNKQRPRCYYMIEEELKNSVIGNVSVTISKYSEYYQVLFQYKDIYFDIETKNITETDLIQFIHSIIKGENNE